MVILAIFHSTVITDIYYHIMIVMEQGKPQQE